MFHLKGRDDALKHYLVVAAALAAASQSEEIGAAALVAVPLVAAGMALSFAFHHVYLGVIVCFLRGEFAAEVANADVAFVNWDMARAHANASFLLRMITVLSAAAIFGASSYFSFQYGMQHAAPDLQNEQWLRIFGPLASIFAGGVVLGSSLMRAFIEKGESSPPGKINKEKSKKKAVAATPTRNDEPADEARSG
jgi:hypothetical protein